MIQCALISVSDKTNIIEFAQGLADLGVQILSTGGTYALLQSEHIPATEVSDYTNFPEIMAGRVKTLHPKVHGGILARRDQDQEAMEQHGIVPIDLVVVNLYPFQATIADPDCTLETAIENIDIGGPTMIRAAAKNHRYVSVLVDPNDYRPTLEALRTDKKLSDKHRLQLAQKAFVHTTTYDTAIANYLSQVPLIAETLADDPTYPNTWQQQWNKVQDLRYGENPHQTAAFYRDQPVANPTPTVASARKVQGKALSFNNIADTDAALECVKQFESPACVIVKHANPCGVAIGESLLEAYQRAYATDPTSAFGGIIAFNATLEAPVAEAILSQQFVEVIIAPSISENAKQVFTQKENIRVMKYGPITDQPDRSYDFKRVSGGLLVQTRDEMMVTHQELSVVTEIQPTPSQLDDLLFAWKVAKFVKSNAIVYAHNQQTIGIGAGQMSRVYSAQIAGIKARDESLEVKGSVMASDAFFPFRDGIDTAAEAGISAIIQPGGSIRDEETILAANEAGIAMVFTGIRHFRH